MYNKRLLKYLLIFCLIAILSYITIVTIAIWNYSNVDEKQTADVIIVLGAGTSDGKVSPVFRERINHGIWLYQNGYADVIIMTGGIGEGNAVSDAYVAMQYAIEKGISKENIILEENSTITQENLENAKGIMKDKSLNTAIIVSDPLHMKRAMTMADDYGIRAYSSPTPTTRYMSLKSKIPFMAREVFFYVGYKIYSIFV